MDHAGTTTSGTGGVVTTTQFSIGRPPSMKSKTGERHPRTSSNKQWEPGEPNETSNKDMGEKTGHNKEDSRRELREGETDTKHSRKGHLGNRKKLQTKLWEMKLDTSWKAFGGDRGNWRKKKMI